MVGTGSSLQAGGSNTTDIVRTLKAFMIEQSLPLWAGEGWDPSTGGFVERLDREGKADRAAARRVRVQARQIYAFAKAAQLDWYPAGRDIALKGLEYMLAKARRPDGRPGYVHTLGSDGGVLNPLRDSYDHAFVLLALATVFALTKDSQVREEIDSVLAFLDGELRSVHGGVIEGVPASLPRRQNPHMHLFEAMNALYEATGEAQFQNRAGDLFHIFVTHLFDPQTQTLGEYFGDDWARISPAVVEPGHQAEWVWLLRGFERNTGCPTANYRTALLASALRYGDEATGCLIDEGDPTGYVTRTARRLWPQTEIAKAWLAQSETSEPGAKGQAEQALVRLYRYYLRHPVPGGWFDQFDATGVSLVDTVPASSLYHVLCAITEAARVLE